MSKSEGRLPVLPETVGRTDTETHPGSSAQGRWLRDGRTWAQLCAMEPRPTPFPRPGPHLQVPVVVFTQQLQEAQDGLHDGDDRAHLQLVLGLVRRSLGALPGLVVVVGVGLPPEGGEGFLGGRRGLQELISNLFRYLRRGLFGWNANERPSTPQPTGRLLATPKVTFGSVVLVSAGDPHGWPDAPGGPAFSQSSGRVNPARPCQPAPGSDAPSGLAVGLRAKALVQAAGLSFLSANWGQPHLFYRVDLNAQ